MNIACILSVRNKAKRYPGKVLADIAGQPLTNRLLQRLKLAKKPSEIILSTSTNPNDDSLIDIAKAENVGYFQGSEDDKLDRYYHTALKYKLDAMIIVDGDDLLTFAEYIDEIHDALSSGQYDCVQIEGLPLGAYSIGVTTAALQKILKIKDSENTEVWGGYFRTPYFNTKIIEVTDPLYHHPEIRFTIDYEEDYQLLQAIYAHFGNRNDFTSQELMELLVHEKPELTSINKGAQQKYENHLESSTHVKFKENINLEELESK